MKHLQKVWSTLFLFLLLFSCTTKNKDESTQFQVIPLPKLMESQKDSFIWNSSSSIITTVESAELIKSAEYLQNKISNSTGKSVEIKTGSADSENAIILSLDNAVAGDESYTLSVNKKRVLIAASKPAGIFYGVQTLLQMMPAEILQQSASINNITVHGVEVSDSPRFPYRGMHMDVSRNFSSADDVKKFIDLIAMYKFNRFHWHLTDGAGWRIEIKKYPLLTQKTAYRPYENWKAFWNGDRHFCDQNDPKAKGGYYTQEQIKDVVAYAAARFITIIPEIELPGHSEEVFVAYPQLCCTGKAYAEGDFCAGNEETFQFLENVLSEVIELFPSEYIHIGGDEAAKTAWKKCPKCKDRMQKENLKDVNELQSYFVHRVSDFLASKGRKIIGWDEIIEGGINSSATVMVWRDEKTGEKAARNGNQVIMTPGNYCYFDQYQTDPSTEPEAIGGYLTLRKVYRFDPVTNDSLSSHVLGGQANLWAEYIPDYKYMEYMAFPRVLALSETLWSERDSKDWGNFKMRLFTNHLSRLDYLGVNYHKPSYQLDMFEKVDTIKKRIEITFDSEQYQPEIHYTLDGSIPTAQSPLYKKGFYVDDKRTIVTAAVFKDGKPAEPILTKETGYHLAIGKKVTYNTTWQGYPAGGETALVDGKRGGLNYNDLLWQGFTDNMDVVIDLEKVTKVNDFHARFMQLTGPDVYMPRYVEVSLSEDGLTYQPVLKVENTVPESHDRLKIVDFCGSLEGKSARYIKVFVKKNKGFIFTDEFVIY